MTTFDPDTDVPPSYDDRPIRIIKEPDPVRQKRGRNNRQRGHKAEREWFALITRACSEAGLPVRDWPERRGTSGAEDGHWDTAAFSFSFEIKSLQSVDGRFPPAGARLKAWEQARRRCGHRTPVVVECSRAQGKPSKWRVWFAELVTDGAEWISSRVLEAKA